MVSAVYCVVFDREVVPTVSNLLQDIHLRHMIDNVLKRSYFPDHSSVYYFVVIGKSIQTFPTQLTYIEEHV